MLSKPNAIERLALTLFLLLICLSAGLYLYSKLYPTPAAAPYQQLGGDFTLDHVTGPITLSGFSGRGVVMMFGYSSCPDICPSGLANLAAALSRLSNTQQQQVQPLFISVDPERDTPEQLDQYSRYFYPTLLGLTANKATIDSVVNAYGAFYRKVEMPGSALDYSVDHSARIYLIDRNGQLVNTLNHNTPVAEFAAAIQQLL
ncbi:MAG: SCO family protein [Halopseudomonas sp.]